MGLIFMGSAAEPADEVGPTVVAEGEVRAEWHDGFDIINLRPFYFDPPREGEKRYLGWSCLLQKATNATNNCAKKTRFREISTSQ